MTKMRYRLKKNAWLTVINHPQHAALNRHYETGAVFTLISRDVGTLKMVMLESGDDTIYISEKKFGECFEIVQDLPYKKDAKFYTEGD